MYKKIFSALFLTLFFAMNFFVVTPSCSADVTLGTSYGTETGLSNKDPRSVIASIIKITMTFLGIIAVMIVLLGGFKWMTAQGNEEQVTEARNIMTRGVIGLIIVLSAWGIANLILNSVFLATGN